MADNWDALVLDNYSAVMPLTWRKKMGVRYLYQPAFMQQGGIFMRTQLDIQTQKEFLSKATAVFKFAEITLNSMNATPDHPSFEIGLRCNYLLRLDKGYEATKKNFSFNFQKNLRRANNGKLSCEFTDNYSSIISLYKDLYGSRLKSFAQNDYDNILKVCCKAATTQRVIALHVKDLEGSVVAGAVLLCEKKRVYNLVSAVTKAGRTLRANFLLYDELILSLSGSDYILDLEGSDHPGIAAFYESFGPVKETYSFIRYNNLPAIIKWLKSMVR